MPDSTSAHVVVVVLLLATGVLGGLASTTLLEGDGDETTSLDEQESEETGLSTGSTAAVPPGPPGAVPPGPPFEPPPGDPRPVEPPPPQPEISIQGEGEAGAG